LRVQEITIWDATTGRPVGERLRHDNVVWFAQLSLDGRCALTASSDGTARIWDSRTGHALGKPT